MSTQAESIVSNTPPSEKGVLHDTFQAPVTKETLKSSTAVARVLFIKKLLPPLLEPSDYSKMLLELEADRAPEEQRNVSELANDNTQHHVEVPAPRLIKKAA